MPVTRFTAIPRPSDIEVRPIATSDRLRERDHALRDERLALRGTTEVLFGFSRLEQSSPGPQANGESC